MENRINMQEKMKCRRCSSTVPACMHVVFVSSILFLVSFLLCPDNVTAAANGDYRTIGTGVWSNTAVWEKYNGTVWIAAVASPTSLDKVITIQPGHTITVATDVTVDQVIINAGGTVVINNGITYTIANGTSVDLSVSGTITNAGVISINSGATVTIQGTGIYQHNHSTTPGAIPAATWIAGSTCEIIGYTTNSTAPSGLQTFSNFTWNCPGQQQDISLGGGLTTANGNLTIANTGTKKLIASAGAITFTVGQDFIQTGGTFVLTNSNNAATINIAGNFNQTGGTFIPIDGNNTATVNLSSDLTQTGSNIAALNSGVANFIFKKAGTQTLITSGHTVNGTVNFTVNNNAKLAMGTSILYGNNFTLSAGAEIQIGSPEGISSSGFSGNVQVTGTRSFNTGADYAYTGSVSQITGSGLPATVRNFRIDNSSNISLTNSVSISSILTFINGKILTGTNEIYITGTSTGNITGHSTTKYVVGLLRRAVSASGTYNFPIGTLSNYELIVANLSSVSGVSNILAKFNNTNTYLSGPAPNNIVVEGLPMDNMLDYGYWTLTPNSSIVSGTFTATVSLQGHSTVGSNSTFTLLRRANNSVNWTSTGTHNPATQSNIGGLVTAARSAMNVFGDFGIAYGELIRFDVDSLMSGTAGQVGAIYRFPNVCYNIDAWVEILNISGGAVLTNIDDNSVGYDEGWQPFIQAPAGSNASIYWKISLKVHDTSIDTTVSSLYLTALDIDGAANLKEYVEAYMPYSYATSTPTNLTIANVNGYYRATSNNTTIANIDTSQSQVMFQVRYTNINTFYWRTGIINSTGSSVTRQTALYFKSFVSGNVALPIELISFSTVAFDDVVQIKWTTASEINNSYFTVERSGDGINFERISQKEGSGTSTKTIYYTDYDQSPLSGTSYYRLKQTDFDGKYTYSDIEVVYYERRNAELAIRTIGPVPFLTDINVNFSSRETTNVKIYLMSAEGKTIAQNEVIAMAGNNNYKFNEMGNLNHGIYYISIISGDQKITQKIIR